MEREREREYIDENDNGDDVNDDDEGNEENVLEVRMILVLLQEWSFV